ncbi:MAG: TVP38/TMEM64 family protein [Rhodospirillales bacterium]|jgi:uncharacterized membrane protein YdjX (TVP38/TMEM64 family)|nr:TVP38/TMEM64 family protein [Rhodospirillales bacterium]
MDRPFTPWRLVPLIVVGAGLAAFFLLELDAYLSFEALREHRQVLLAWRSENYFLLVTSFIALYGLMAAFSVPGAVWMTISGGFLFGPVVGTAASVTGATLGAVALFLAARYALGDILRAKAGPAIRKMEAGFNENALSYLFILRLVPLFPFWLVNLVPALLGVKLGTFFLATFFGIIPGSLVFTLVGSGLGSLLDAGMAPDLNVFFEPEILLPIAGLVVLSLIPVIYKKVTKSRSE